MIEIGKALRLSGYDLTLVDYDLIVSDFRNDASANAFTRLVLFIGDSRIWNVAGDANHETLFAYLDREPHGNVRQSHYLWYRWDKTMLRLSGSDTELPSDFEVLKSWCEPLENRHLLLRHMKERHR